MTVIGMFGGGGGSLIDPTSSSQDVATDQSTSSVTFADLATVGPAITLSPGTVKTHLIIHGTWQKNSGTNSTIQSVAIAGAAAVDIDGTLTGAVPYNGSTRHIQALAQASGVTHTCKYRVSAGTGNFQQRRIIGYAM